MSNSHPAMHLKISGFVSKRMMEAAGIPKCADERFEYERVAGVLRMKRKTEAEAPKAEKPKAEAPEAEKPNAKTVKLVIKKPKAAAPKAEKPKTEKAKTENS